MRFDVGLALDLWSGEKRVVRAGELRVLLLRVNEQLRAYEDRCAHLGLSLEPGRLEGDLLTCAHHGWQYDAVSGVGRNPARACLVRLSAFEQDGRIFVETEGAEGG